VCVISRKFRILARRENLTLYTYYSRVSGTEIFELLCRVSFETSFDSKQPKLEPKQVSTLSETRHLFRFDFETARFGVSIKLNQNKPHKGEIVLFKLKCIKQAFFSQVGSALKIMHILCGSITLLSAFVVLVSNHVLSKRFYLQWGSK
jgi:hypothetical protein